MRITPKNWCSWGWTLTLRHPRANQSVSGLPAGWEGATEDRVASLAGCEGAAWSPKPSAQQLGDRCNGRVKGIWMEQYHDLLCFYHQMLFPLSGNPFPNLSTHLQRHTTPHDLVSPTAP